MSCVENTLIIHRQLRKTDDTIFRLELQRVWLRMLSLQYHVFLKFSSEVKTCILPNAAEQPSDFSIHLSSACNSD